MGLRKRSPWTLEESGKIEDWSTTYLDINIYPLWKILVTFVNSTKDLDITNKFTERISGLGRRSPFTSSLDDSGNIADYSTQFLDLPKL